MYNLTKAVISQNPGNYTAWYIRYKCFEKLPLLQDKLGDELEYLNGLITDVHKIYQYWHYRKLIVSKYGKLPDNEYDTLDDVYDIDPMNYHMWTYRVWLTTKYNAWETELEDTTIKIELNSTNNSLWSYKHYLVFSRRDYLDVAREEIEFAKRYIMEDKNNESAWFYYKGILFYSPDKALENKKEVLILAEKLKEEAKDFSEEIIKEDKKNRFAQMLLVDILKQKKETLKEAIDLCARLSQIDQVRNKYWNWYKHKLENN